MSDDVTPPVPGEVLLYNSDEGSARLEIRFDGDTLWMTQAQMAELFQTSPQNITLHLKAVFADGEIDQEATCKDYLQVRSEGERSVSRALRHYALPAILAVGMRVRSPRGTQFRQWAIARLDEYLRKGFVMDDERIKRLTLSIEQGWSPQCESYSAEYANEWGVLKVGAVNGGTFDPSKNRRLPAELEPLTELSIPAGDLLVSRAALVHFPVPRLITCASAD